MSRDKVRDREDRHRDFQNTHNSDSRSGKIHWNGTTTKRLIQEIGIRGRREPVFWKATACIMES